MSDTNVEVIAPWQPSALDREAEALIKATEAEFDAAEPEAPESPPAPDTGGTSEPGLEAAPAKPVTAGEVPAADKSKAEGMSEFVARELALFRREEALALKESKFQTMEQELTALRSRNLPEDIVDGLRYQTSQTLTALGIDPDALVKQVLADRMGDKAPEDLRAEVRDAAREFETNRKIRALENKLAEQERAERARTYFMLVQDGAREYLKAAGVNEHAPTVAKVASTDTDFAYSEIMAEIQKDAEFKAMRDPSAPLITYDEAARRVESRWSKYQKVFTPAGVPPQNESPKPPSTPAPKSANTPATTTNRPLAPWLQRTEIEEDGLKAAIAEYRRLQG